jgi:hypothetical protein
MIISAGIVVVVTAVVVVELEVVVVLVLVDGVCGCKIMMAGLMSEYEAVTGPFGSPPLGMRMAPVVVTTEA